MQDLSHVLCPYDTPYNPRKLSKICFYKIKYGENVNISIDCYFRAHMEYKCTEGGLQNYREALARFTEFSNLHLGFYTPYAHENSNQSLNIQL